MIFPRIRRPFRGAEHERCSVRNVANCRNLGQWSYPWLFPSSTLSLDVRLPCVKAIHRQHKHSSSMGALMLRIERSANGQVTFTLSGRMQTADIEPFRQLLVVEAPGQRLIFNLRDVTLVNQDAVTFLADCEANGIKIVDCPLHIRNWIDQEKSRHRRRRQKRDTKGGSPQFP